MLELKDREWKEFFIGDLFTVKRPQARSEKEYQVGQVPFVASGNVNNGVIKSCIPHGTDRLDKGNCITVSPVDGNAFYQGYEFLGRGGAGSSILILYNDLLGKYSGIFVARMIRQTCSKYSYGKMGNQERIKREKIMLPVDEAGNPDYEFIEQYIKEREQQLLQKYIDYAYDEGQINEKISLEDREWKTFNIGELFILEHGKSKSSGELIKTENGISYLGATNRNNAVVDFVEPVSELIQKGNCIAFICRGEGSVGYSVYKSEPFIAQSSITVGYADFLNRYTGTFITTVADKVREKYNFNYGRDSSRLKKEFLMLPTDLSGSPDYAFMEEYMKQKEKRLIKEYMDYVKKK